MEEYYFLFGLALVFCVFASIQDIRKREVANWLNFSLVAFALTYRILYSIINNDFMFLFFGILGFIIFFAIANCMYYGKVFAGGDAKLLMGLGLIMPFNNYWDILFVSLGFLIVLFVVGAFYSLIYSSILVLKKRDKFAKEFMANLNKKKWLIIMGLILFCLLTIPEIFIGQNKDIIFFGSMVILILPFLYIYLIAIEKSCMIVLLDASKLTEGDWIERDIKVGGKLVKKTVHGLNIEDIKILRKYDKKVWVKQGVPFVPAFLFALIITGFFYLILQLDFQSLFFYLF